MRMLILLALACLTFPSTLHAATAIWNANQVFGPRTQMIGHWTFNGPDVNWTTGTVLDRSGWGNHASLVGLSTTTSPVAGKLGQAFRFDGVNDQIFVEATSANNLPAMTISAWVYPLSAGGGGVGRIVEKADGTQPNNGWTFRMNGNTLLFAVDYSGTNLSKSTAASTLSLNRWQHVVVTWDGSTSASNIHLYIDGAEPAVGSSSNGTLSRVVDQNSLLFIGSEVTLARLFNGSIDDVRIFSRVLTPQEIAILAKAGRTILNVAPKPAPATKGNLVGHWTFDGPDVNWTTGTVLDKSGQGNHGSMFNLSTTSSPAIGKLGQAFRFKPDPVVDYVDAGSAASFDNLSQLTVNAWVKITDDGIIVQKTNISTPIWLYGWRFSISGGVPDFEAGASVSRLRATGLSSLRGKGWHMVTATWTGGLEKTSVRIYVDGVDVTFDPGGLNGSGTRGDDSARNLTIGGMSNQISSNFDGSIDDVRIYNRVLTPAEVATLYRSGTVTIKPFTCGVSTVSDADGNIYNTVKIGSQCWMKQNMRVGTMITAGVDQTDNVTIEKWCYDNTLANCMTNNNPNYPDGGLYQWDEAMQYSTTPGARGICPAGWHIPTHDEFTTLERAVCTSGTCATDFPYDTTTIGYRGTDEGTKLKPNGTSGFEGNISGYSNSGSFYTRTLNSYVWSSLERGANAWFRNIHAGGGQMLRSDGTRSAGLPVRCLKD